MAPRFPAPRALPLFVMLIACLACAPLVRAGSPPVYRYGSSWWEEYVADDDTEILLHAGPPQVSGRAALNQALTQKRKQEKTDTDLMDLEALDDMPDNSLGVEVDVADMRQAPVDDSNVPANVLLDYSDRRRKLSLGPGVTKVPDGRFGAGLAFDGSGAVAFDLERSAAPGIELSFRVDTYPDAPVCLISVQDDETRLLLHPDGHLELKLKSPHGFPQPANREAPPLTDQQLAAITSRDATIRSPEPVGTGRWVHVQVYNMQHPTPGGGEPWDARLKVDGFDVAWYQSERYNRYEYLGRARTPVVIGNNAKGTQGFRGVIDEVRALRKHKTLYERPTMAWRQTATHAPNFDRPYFRRDHTVFHASLQDGLGLDRHADGADRIALELKGQGADGLHVPGIRGHGWVLDRRIGYPRFPLTGLNAMNGGLEFWLRPVNWDDVTGYWQHTPPRPPRDLTVATFVGRDTKTGETVPFMRAALPRAHNIERGRLPVDPGHWMHLLVSWNDRWLEGADLFIDGKRRARAWRADPAVLARIEPLYVELGVAENVTVRRGEIPLVEIDEVVGYSSTLDRDEVPRAMARWKKPLESIPLYDSRLDFKWSIQRLDFTLQPMLPDGQVAATATAALIRDGATVLAQRQEPGEDGAFHFRLNDGDTLPYADYRVDFALLGADGNELLADSRDWQYAEDPWRHNRAGILDQPMPPWTPVALADGELRTRMSSYRFGDAAWPSAIIADGVDLLAGPVTLYADDQPLSSQASWAQPTAVDADFTATISGQGLRIHLQGHAEYDGMLKYTLTLATDGDTPPPALRLEIPIKPEHASHLLWYPVGNRGVSAATIPAATGMVRDSGWPSQPWKAWAQARKAGKTWDDWWPGYAQKNRDYGFFAHVDINDLNRGLWWFADNAAGWGQTPETGAVQILRRDDHVALVLNLVAPGSQPELGQPIVFAFLPHPARPPVPEYRSFQRRPVSEVGLAADIFDAFRPWPTSPRAGGKSLNMTLYPATDPAAPDAGPSWDYAESTIPSLRAAKPDGARTLYLSKAWFSARAGAYDNWEWRSGTTSTVSLTPSFVNYICWEIDQWIGRGIWDAIYLDECYEHPAINPLAGHSVVLPNGQDQPGVTNFQFRELMKRWRGIFHQHGKKPYMMAHHTYSWQYPGILYTDAYLDGENAPIVSLNSRDWIDSISKARYEIIQNSRLWGLASFYMPYIAEGGFAEKEKSSFPVWQWRMARQAQAMFAHYETATVYEGQGADVHHRYWDALIDWGVADIDAVSFHPYWDAAGIQVDDQGGKTLVSYYRHDASGRLLLIASNLRKGQIAATITLDRQALGLPAGPLTIRELDPTIDPPPGDDYLGEKGVAAAQAEAEAALDENPLLGTADTELLDELGGGLDGDAEKTAAEKQALTPSIDGDRITLPIRARDYRVITITP